MGIRIPYTKGQRLNESSKLTFNRDLPDSFTASGKVIRYAVFDCDCGGQKECTISDVKRGDTSQCNDCYGHGMTGTPLYRKWKAMKERCDNPNSDKYDDYGGRGITYAPEWVKFEPFMEWSMQNGWKPGLELDREDNSLNYTQDNCRFITPKKNKQNKYTSKWWIVNGVIFESCTDAADILGVSHSTIQRWCDGGQIGDYYYPPRPNCRSVHKYINGVKQPYPTV